MVGAQMNHSERKPVRWMHPVCLLVYARRQSPSLFVRNTPCCIPNRIMLHVGSESVWLVSP